MFEVEGILKFKSGKYLKPVTFKKENNRLYVSFGFDKNILAEIKAMEGSRWHGFDDVNPRKIWSITDSSRNRFQLQFLAHLGNPSIEDPYKRYDGPLVDYTPNRTNLYMHQKEMVQLGLTTHRVEWSIEMGGGKTLALIELMEASGYLDWYYIGPKSALYSVILQFEEWDAKITPRFYTYENLKKLVENWPADREFPRGIAFDESSRVKNPTTQRSQAAKWIADAIRERWGYQSFIVNMSGSPAPKDPSDWHNQIEILEPGFLREGTKDKFKKRMAIIKVEPSITGGTFPKLVTWLDNPLKCKHCGDFQEQHDVDTDHGFEKSIDEVSYLYQRVKGIVIVKFKKDILDLPDIIFKKIQCEPTQSILNAARTISAKAPSTISALTLLRELSDGFQYQEIEIGEMACPRCNGSRISTEMYDKNDPENLPTPDEFTKGYRLVINEDTWETGNKIEVGEREIACEHCNGTGTVCTRQREAIHVPCPKEDAYRDILEEHEDIGRLTTFAGFTGSIDRCVKIAQSVGWTTIRVDSRGWISPYGNGLDALRAFSSKKREGKINFIAHPASGGMGLNLTSSPTIVFYSNDFNAENRIQALNRGHRPGMDLNRGCTVIDLIHLPSDIYVLDNLDRKIRLQDMSLGKLRESIEEPKLKIRMDY